MKKFRLLLYFFLVLTTFTSCNQKELTELEEKIHHLQVENKLLMDSISKMELKKLSSLYVIGSAQQTDLKVNREITIDFEFGYRNDINNYDVYRIVEGERELVLSDQNKTDFQFRYIPESINDNHINLELTFDLDSIQIQVPASVTLHLTD